MGYYTFVSIEITDKDQKPVDLLTKYTVTQQLLQETDMPLDPDGTGSMKWYETPYRELLEFSKLYPDLIFCVNGSGEENSDIWEEYYWDGKSQRLEAEVVVPPFDPEGWR